MHGDQGISCVTLLYPTPRRKGRTSRWRIRAGGFLLVHWTLCQSFCVRDSSSPYLSFVSNRIILASSREKMLVGVIDILVEFLHFSKHLTGGFSHIASCSFLRNFCNCLYLKFSLSTRNVDPVQHRSLHRTLCAASVIFRGDALHPMVHLRSGSSPEIDSGLS